MAEREEALALLDASYNGILTTLSASGRPIGTPVWSALIDGFLYIRTMTSSAKVRRLRVDPRCSFVVEAGDALDELHYAHVSADAVFVEDAERAVEGHRGADGQVRPRAARPRGPRY